MRKMNPRNGTFDDRTHRLLRRGIPFAKSLHVEPPVPGADDEVEHGLAFNAFMGSIENQFEFLQRSWARLDRHQRGSVLPAGASERRLHRACGAGALTDSARLPNFGIARASGSGPRVRTSEGVLPGRPCVETGCGQPPFLSGESQTFAGSKFCSASR